MSNKAQGTIEYLVIIAIIVVISLMITYFAMGGVDNANSVSEGSFEIKNKVGYGGIGIVESATDNSGDAILVLQNNSGDGFRLNMIESLGTEGNVVEESEYDTFVSLGTMIPFQLNENSCSCEVGQISKTCRYKITFTTIDGLTKSEIITINSKCSGNLIPNNNIIVPLSHNCFNLAENPIPICSLSDLNRVREDLTANYILMEDIDASETISWNNDAGWDPLGIGEIINRDPYAGIFDGNNHTISNLHIYRPSQNYVGLFGFIMGEIKNLNLVNVSVTGYSNVGGLVGKVYDLDGVFGLVSKCSSTGDINGLGYHTGGLVGASSGIIEKSFSKGTVTGRNTVGGLVAYLEVDGNLSNSYSQADVLGIDGIPYIPVSAVGGLVGYSEDVDINNSYSTGVVSIETSEPSYDIGGLVGRISFGVNVSNSYYSDNSGQSDTGKGTKVEDYRMKWSSTYLTRGWNLLSTSGFEMYPKLGWEVGITNYIWWMTEPT